MKRAVLWLLTIVLTMMLIRMLGLAAQWRLPLVLFAEGGGGRPGDTDFVGVAGLDCHTFVGMARLSGLVPLVGVVSGRCFAGNAALLGCCDVIITTQDANIGMGGPAMIEGGGLGAFAPEDIGPVSVQAPNGVVDVVVADEAHRTQYGFSASLKVPDLKVAEASARYQVGYAQHLRDALPNATFVGFTGTPVSSTDHDTRAVFGEYIHVYDMQQAIDDLTASGYPVVQTGRFGEATQFAYCDTRAVLGHYTEIISFDHPTEALFERIRNGRVD